MVTYSDLFQFVIMLVAVITLVYSCTKSNRSQVPVVNGFK